MKLLFLVVVLTVAVVFTNAKEDDTESFLTEKDAYPADVDDDDKVTEKRDAGEDGENEIIDRETRSNSHRKVFYKLLHGHRIRYVMILRNKAGGYCAALKQFSRYHFLKIIPAYRGHGMLAYLPRHQMATLKKGRNYYMYSHYKRSRGTIYVHRYFYRK